MTHRAFIVPFVLLFLIKVFISPNPVRATPLPPYPLTQTHPKNYGSNPYSLFEFQNELYFGTDRGFWKTDGSEPGTIYLNDIPPDLGSPYDSFRAYKDDIYYNSSGSFWKLSNSSSEPIMVFPAQVSIRMTAELNGDLYFIPFLYSSSEQYPYGLWKINGTTGMAEPIYRSIGNFSSDLIAYHNLLFFTGFNEQGYSLWISDGTFEGTGMLKDIRPTSGSYGDRFIIFQDRLFFTAWDSTNGYQLWSSDGTPENTVIVTGSCSPQSNVAYPRSLTVAYNFLYFIALGCDNRYHLYITDGTVSGTIQLNSIGWAASPVDLLAVDNTLYFFARDEVTNNGIISLWKSNGTPSGTGIVQQVGYERYPDESRNLTFFKGKLFFTHFKANVPDGELAYDFWISDGTPEGTGLFSSVSPSLIYAGENTLYFVGDNNIDGKELWRTDGTSVGTSMVKNIVYEPPMEPVYWVKGTNQLFFKPQGEAYYWVTNGSVEHTHSISGAGLCEMTGWYQHPDDHLTIIGNVFYYPGIDCQLWRTDGTTQGTFRLSQGISTASYSGLLALTPFNNKLIFFTSEDWATDWSTYDLWSSDETPAGTGKLLSLNEAGAGTNVIPPVAFEDAVFFFTIHASNADRNVRWVKFWKTDGTKSGTKVVFDTRTFTNFNGLPEKLVTSGSHLFFTSRNSDYLQVLWESDSTLAGTQVVSPIDIGEITDMVDADGTLFILNRKVLNQYGLPWLPTLYKTRGKEFGGLETVYTFPQRGWDLDEKSVTAVGSRIFFKDIDQDHAPARLWVSDGTQNGTHPVMVNNGLTFPTTQLEPMGNGIAFVGYEAYSDHQEIWFSDGSANGSYPITDLQNGEYDKMFGHMAYVDGKLFFAYHDGQKGYQMWVYNFLTERIRLPLVTR